MLRAKINSLQQTGSSMTRGVISKAWGAQSKYFYQLLFATLFLVVFGLVMVLSSSSIDSLVANNDALYKFVRQAIFAGAGIIGLFIASGLSIDQLYKWGHILGLVGIAMQLAVLFTPLGIDVNGNRAWMRFFFGTSIQPGEFLKLGLIIYLARFLTEQIAYRDFMKLYTWKAMWPVAIVIGLIVIGKDMGTSVVVVIIALLMVYLTGAPTEHLRMPITVAAVGGIVLVMSGPSRMARITAWLSGGSDTANDFAWQSVHGTWALAAGSLTGVGLGASKMKWSWIPEVENDFIFAIIGEELGMVGACMTIGVFVFLSFCIYRIAMRTEDQFARMVALGVLVWLSAQSAINIAVVLRALPVLGVPLPLISYGGSSLTVALLAIGAVLAIERNNHRRLGRYATQPNRQGKARMAAK